MSQIHAHITSPCLAEAQQNIEYQYSKKHVDLAIKFQIENCPDTQIKIDYGVKLLQEWLKESYYPSKNARLEHIKAMDLHTLVIQIFTGIAYLQESTLYVSITAALASRLKFDDKRDSIMTIAEIVAVLCHTDAYDIYKENEFSSLRVLSRIKLSSDLTKAIKASVYMPPMVSTPQLIESNYESAYLTFNDSLLLGRENSHDKNICLDVINIQNQVPLSLNFEFLTTVPEKPTHALDTLEKTTLWDTFLKQSRDVYQLMRKNGNRFWITNKTDTRGRLYAQGYHINPQGTAYKKAMIQLADKEHVTGVPNGI